jgi:uncharacterized protein
MKTNPLNIAVVGAGVAGITAAYILQRQHQITLFEKNNYLGGHTNTITIDSGPDAGAVVDTGFIVLNDKTYPTFHRLLAQLGVSVRNSDMSFGFHDEKTGIQYAGINLNTIFTQRKNILNPSFLRMLYDIRRFGKIARLDINQGIADGLTLGQYIEQGGYSHSFTRDYLLPMGAAIWSTPADEMLAFPAQTFLRFFDNHGLLSLEIPQWQTVVGGSHAYVHAFREQFQGNIVLGQPIQGIARNIHGVQIKLANGDVQTFDKVIIAAHADEAFRLLEDPTPDETKFLSVWKYNKNMTVLHTDSSVMPSNHRAWASWNYTREETGQGNEPLSLTYHMNRLQGLTTQYPYFVTLNRTTPVDSASVIKEITYMHPMYDFKSTATQPHLPTLNGVNHTYYCGSYFGYGFHEDAVVSGVNVANCFGLEL